MSIIEKLGITKAPWRVGTGSDKDGLFIVGKNINDQVITGGHNKYEKFGVNENQDAQLIATAPEMLEALITTMDRLERDRGITDTVWLNDDGLDQRTLFDELHHVVEKATNKSWEEIKELLK